jgi:hypothetical protein
LPGGALQRPVATPTFRLRRVTSPHVGALRLLDALDLYVDLQTSNLFGFDGMFWARSVVFLLSLSI